MGITPLRPGLKGLAFFLLTATCAMAAPTISSFTPTTGTIGTVVTITGTGFTGATAVTFHGVAATKYTVVSVTQITATAPTNVSTGPIKVTVAATSATSSTSFTVTPGMALSISAGHPLISTTVSGAGFHAAAPVDAYFDSTDLALFVTSASGTVSTTFQIPAQAQPGQHWITFIERGSYLSAQKAFTVRTDWDNQGFGPSGRGVNPYENTINSSNVDNLTTAWGGYAGGFANESPFVVAGGSVFVADVNNDLRAYSKTGALLWTAAPGADIQRRAIVAALGRVFLGDATGAIFSYSQTCRSDGGVCSPQWTASIGFAVTAGLTFWKGTLYVPGADGMIHPVNPATGALGTPFAGYDNVHGPVTTPIVFDADGSFFYGAGTELEFHETNGSSGAYGYQGNLSPIAVNNGSAFFTTAEGMLHRTAGGFYWDATTSGANCFVAPVIANGYVYAGGCSNLGAYSPKTGAIQWNLATGYIRGISEANGVLYVCEGGNLEAYDPTYASHLWTGNWCNSAPEIVNGTLYSAYATITAYDLNTAVGNVRPAPAAMSLRPDYSLKPQFSGAPVAAGSAAEPDLE